MFSRSTCVLMAFFCLAFFPAGAQHCIDDFYSETAVLDSSDITIYEDIEYGQASNFFSGQEVSLKMDVYAPADYGINGKPMLMLIHGGGFIGGDKSEMSTQAFEFARRGFVVASINYRLGWNCDNTLCINCYGSNLQKAIYCAVQDARAAMRYFHENALSWWGDTNFIFIGGESAGSITAMLTTFWSQEEADAQVESGFASLVGNLNESGNNLNNVFNIRAVVNQCGAIPVLSHMNGHEQPIISFHDSNDCVVPYQSGPLIGCFCSGFLSYQGSFNIHNYRVSNGQCSELHTVPQILPNHCSYPDLNIVKLASCFMKRVMCGYCMSFADADVNSTPLCSDLHATDLVLGGCTYESAYNYDPSATFDDGSCGWDYWPDCLGDLNDDGLVNTQDVLIMIANFGSVCP